jgi:hypothetical protein
VLEQPYRASGTGAPTTSGTGAPTTSGTGAPTTSGTGAPTTAIRAPWVVIDLKPTALARTNSAKSDISRHFFMTPPSRETTAEESISASVPSRGEFHVCVSKEYTPTPPLVARGFFELSKGKVAFRIANGQCYESTTEDAPLLNRAHSASPGNQALLYVAKGHALRRLARNSSVDSRFRYLCGFIIATAREA